MLRAQRDSKLGLTTIVPQTQALLSPKSPVESPFKLLELLRILSIQCPAFPKDSWISPRRDLTLLPAPSLSVIRSKLRGERGGSTMYWYNPTTRAGEDILTPPNDARAIEMIYHAPYHCC